MTHINRTSLVAAAAIAAALAALPLAARADQKPAQAEQGFNADTGQINQGHPQIPSTGHTRPIPTQEEARAALMMPDNGAISTGAASGSMPVGERATTGMTNAEQPVGPIGSKQQTVPAKFSQRNDTLDRMPTMAWPYKLDDAARKRVFDAVMADDTKPIAAAENLAPAHALSAEQAANAVHPLPLSLRDLRILEGLSYVKTEKEVFLVRPDTRTVVDTIGQS